MGKLKSLLNHVSQFHQVLDTPGFCDQKRSDDEISEIIAQFLAGLSPGPHAVLVVIKASERYSSDFDKAYTEAKKLIGEQNLASRIILVFTGGDLLKQNKVDIKTMLAEVRGVLKEMMKDASDRYIVFNNKATGRENKQQLEKLLGLVREASPMSFLSSLTQIQIEKIVNNASEQMAKDKGIPIEKAHFLVRQSMAEGKHSESLNAIKPHVKSELLAHKVDVHVNFCFIL